MPLTKGYDYTHIASSNRNTSEINDVQTLTDEFSERVGLALRVPIALIKGNAENTEAARTDLIMYGVKPIAQMIKQEYNAKRLGAATVQWGSRLYIDPMPIQLSNMESVSNFCERMTSCGQYSVDELRDLRGEPLLGTPEAQKHYITKNYGELGAEEGSQNSAAENNG